MIVEWNTHSIRPTKNQNSPSGRPMIMYRLPNLYNTRDFLNPVLPNEIAVCRDECTFRSDKPCDEEFFELCMIYTDELNTAMPRNANDAIELYLSIRTKIYQDL